MRLRSLVGAALCALSVGLLGVAARAAEPDSIVLYNGKVFTANDSQPWASGVAMAGPFIVKVGSDQQVLALRGPRTRAIDLQGRTVIPGLNNAHAHAFWGSSFPHAVSINGGDFIPGPGPTFAEILSFVAAGAAQNAAGTWLFGTIGTGVSDDPSADRFQIDAVAPNHPVLLFPWHGHGVYFNTKAMQLMGISETQADPFAGVYERVPGTQIVRGIAQEYAGFLINRYFAHAMSDQEFVTLLRKFDQDALRFGFTSIQDYGVGLEHSRALDLVDRAKLAVRWRAVCFPLSLNEACDQRARYSPYFPLSKVQASGIKWITDGSPIERFAHVTVPYLDRPGWYGNADLDAAAFRSVLQRALFGLPIRNQTHLHIAGDANWDTMLQTMSTLAPDAAWRQRRTRVEHGDLFRADQFQQAKRKGVIVVGNPTHFGIRPLFEQRFQPSVVATMMPWKTLLAEGIPIAVGTDSIGSPGNPFLDIFLSLIHPTRPSEGLGVEDTVRAYTRGSAFAEFQEVLKGKLQVGQLADIAVLSQDIFTLPPPAIVGTESVLTIVGGRVAYENGI